METLFGQVEEALAFLWVEQVDPMIDRAAEGRLYSLRQSPIGMLGGLLIVASHCRHVNLLEVVELFIWLFNQKHGELLLLCAGLLGDVWDDQRPSIRVDVCELFCTRLALVASLLSSRVVVEHERSDLTPDRELIRR